MTQKQLETIQEFGKKIEVKVTPDFREGVLFACFRGDHHVADFNLAALILQQIQRTELPESHTHLLA